MRAVDPEHWYASVGDVVRRRRQERFRSMREAAREAGISEATWRHIETGKRSVGGMVVAPNPGPDVQASIGRALDWPPDCIDRLRQGDELPAPSLFSRAESGLLPKFDPRAGRAGVETLNDELWSVIARAITRLATEMDHHRAHGEWAAVHEDIRAVTGIIEAANGLDRALGESLNRATEPNFGMRSLTHELNQAFTALAKVHRNGAPGEAKSPGREPD